MKGTTMQQSITLRHDTVHNLGFHHPVSVDPRGFETILAATKDHVEGHPDLEFMATLFTLAAMREAWRMHTPKPDPWHIWVLNHPFEVVELTSHGDDTTYHVRPRQ